MGAGSGCGVSTTGLWGAGSGVPTSGLCGSGSGVSTTASGGGASTTAVGGTGLGAGTATGFRFEVRLGVLRFFGTTNERPRGPGAGLRAARRPRPRTRAVQRRLGSGTLTTSDFTSGRLRHRHHTPTPGLRESRQGLLESTFRAQPRGLARLQLVLERRGPLLDAIARLLHRHRAIDLHQREVLRAPSQRRTAPRCRSLPSARASKGARARTPTATRARSRSCSRAMRLERPRSRSHRDTRTT